MGHRSPCRALSVVVVFTVWLGPQRADAGSPMRETVPGAVETTVDAEAAAAAISAGRLSRGLPPVTVDARLMRVAELHARRMAAADCVEHVLPGEGSFAARLAEGGVEVAAAENVAGGPRTFAEALQLWRRSPPHAANLLRAEDTRIGLAVAYAPAGRYRMYWSLIVAAADAPPTTEIGDVAVIWPASRPSGH